MAVVYLADSGRLCTRSLFLLVRRLRDAWGFSGDGEAQALPAAWIEEELLCGKLTVFENRQSRTGRTMELNVVVLPALDPNKKRGAAI
jgi:hypothetical protein